MFNHLLCHQNEHVDATSEHIGDQSNLQQRYETEKWEKFWERSTRVHRVICFFLSFFVTLWLIRPPAGLHEVGVFRWQVAWMHIESRCNVSITQILLVWANILKKNQKTITLHLPQNSQEIVFTHTHKPMKKGILQLFFLFTFFKKGKKYIKTYLQCVFFCFFLDRKQKTEQSAMIDCFPLLQVYIRECAPVSFYHNLRCVQ